MNKLDYPKMKVKTTHDLNHRMGGFYLYLLETAYELKEVSLDPRFKAMSSIHTVLEATFRDIAKIYDNMVFSPVTGVRIEPEKDICAMLRNKLN